MKAPGSEGLCSDVPTRIVVHWESEAGFEVAVEGYFQAERNVGASSVLCQSIAGAALPAAASDQAIVPRLPKLMRCQKTMPG